MHKKYSGFAVALNWPETYCKQPGYWYDWIGHYLGFSKHFYYKVGHAAMILIDAENGNCHYYDFGRYHAPFRHGRVRNGQTDPALAIELKAVVEGDDILNFKEILEYMQANKYYCGDGPLKGAYCPINFEQAKAKADEIEAEGPRPFGIFRLGIRNCASFVQKVILAGKPPNIHRLKIKYKVPILVTTSSNIAALKCTTSVSANPEKLVFCPTVVKADLKQFLKTTLKEPPRPASIPQTAQWLSGEGLGSWYDLKQEEENSYRIYRYHNDGVLEATTLSKPNEEFRIKEAYRFVYPSHLLSCHILQEGKIIKFIRL